MVPLIRGKAGSAGLGPPYHLAECDCTPLSGGMLSCCIRPAAV